MKQISILFAITAVYLLASCRQNQHEQLPDNIIALIDFSPSRDSTVCRWYKETVKASILAKMGAKDQFTALPIDYSSETSSEELFTVDFSKNDYSNEFAGLQKDAMEQQNHQDSVTAALQRFDYCFETTKQKRASNPLKGTDIFGALKQAKKYVKPGSKNVLVVLSDMLQYTDRVSMNFEDHLNDTGEIEQYLLRAAKIDLTGVLVVVITGAQNEVRPEKFNVIQAFWQRYFKECNAVVVDYSSGAKTKLEQTIISQP